MKTEQALKLMSKFVSKDPAHAQSIGMIQQKNDFLCATDGFRLAKIAYQAGGSECYFDQNCGVWLDAKYPNIDRVIPKQTENAGFNKKDLLWLLKICNKWQTQAKEYKAELKAQYRHCEIVNVLIGFEHETIYCTVIAQTWQNVPAIGASGKPLKGKTKKEYNGQHIKKFALTVGEHHWVYILRGKRFNLQYMAEILNGLKLCNDKFYGETEPKYIAGTPNINNSTQPAIFQSPSMFFMLMPIKP